MDSTLEIIGGRECRIYNCGLQDRTYESASDGCALLIQPVDDHDIEVLDSEVAHIEKLAPGKPFILAAFRVNDWNTDLSPWPAPPVFGDAAFGAGAEETLSYIEESLLPALRKSASTTVYLGGYSLAGFFSLWSAYKTDAFAGIAAASPSVWFPGWMDYCGGRNVRAPRVYLSLGDKEEKTRNPVMRTVGDCIRRQSELLGSDPACSASILEMNQGNHFREPDLRTARGFAWLLKS